MNGNLLASAAALSDAEFEPIRQRLAQTIEVPRRPWLDMQDFRSALAVMLLVFCSTFPVVLPFIFMHEATRALRAVCPDVAVICLTASANLREVDALFEAGAVACLTKDEHLDTIIEAILRAAGHP